MCHCSWGLVLEMLHARCTWRPSRWQRHLWRQQVWTLKLGEPLPTEKQGPNKGWRFGGRTVLTVTATAVPCPSQVVKPTLKRSHMKQLKQRDCSCRCHMPQEPLKLFKWNSSPALDWIQAVQHRLGTLLVERSDVSLTKSNSILRKEILCTGENFIFSQLTRSPRWLSLCLHNWPCGCARMSQS